MDPHETNKKVKKPVLERILGINFVEAEDKTVKVTVSLRSLIVAYTSSITMIVVLVAFYFNFIRKVNNFENEIHEIHDEVKNIGSRYDRNIRKLQVETNILLRKTGEDRQIGLELHNDPVDSLYIKNQTINQNQK